MVGLTFKHLFTPHYSNNHRPRILQPVGFAVLIGIFILLETWTKLIAYAPLPKGVVLGYASSINAEQVIELTNVERAKVNLPALKHNALLTQAAAAKAANMFQLDYWAHIAPDGTTPWYFIKQAGYSYAVAGENLARDFGDTPTMVEAWMNSPTHKENIVNVKYQEIGVAVVNGTLQGTETTLVVQMFGKPTSAIAQTPVEAASTEKVITRIPTPYPTRTVAVVEVKPTQAIAVKYTPSTNGVTLSSNQGDHSASSWMISPLTLTKAIAFSIMLMLVAVLLYDEFLIQKHQISRRVGKNWAHLTLFGIVLMLIVAITPGKIL
jgi:hypothetical protein